MTTCETCDTYLARRRTVLLPHIGRWVVRTGKPPERLVARLANGHHKEVCADD